MSSQKQSKIINFYKENPDKCYGAVKVDNALGFFDSIIRHSTPTHNKLIKLVEEGILTKCEKWKGFKYKQAGNYRIANQEWNKNRDRSQNNNTEERLKEKMVETFQQVKQTSLIKKIRKQQSYFNKIDHIALCIKISKLHSINNSQKYWYTLTLKEKNFLANFKNSYVFFRIS